MKAGRPCGCFSASSERVRMVWTRQRLRARVHQLRDRRLDPLIGVVLDELDAAQAPAAELAQKLGPERLGLRGADVHAEHLAPAVGVDPNGDDRRDGPMRWLQRSLHVGRVEPDVGPVAGLRADDRGRP